MSGKQFPGRKRGWRGWLTWAAVLAAAWPAGAALAQSEAAAPPPAELPPGAAATAPPVTLPAPADGGVVAGGCSTCGGGTVGGGCGPGCGGGHCVPGRDNCFCDSWAAETACGHFLSGVYQCICCPDPCYEPHWLPVADSAFFVDAARPITQTRLRYDHGAGLENPDRAEYFWARARTTPTQLGPGGPCAPANGVGKGMACIASSVDYDALDLYVEGATGRVGVFVAMPYLSLDPTTSPISLVDAARSTPENPVPRANSGGACCHESGFGDTTVGTKTLLLDCQLLQLSMEFKTFIPSGNFTKGLGTGHVSLEPSLLLGLRLTPDCYLQAQTSYWIPIGGDSLYQADIFHAHVSLNAVLWRPCAGLQLVGTAELNNWWVQGGAYTSTNFLAATPNGLAPVSVSSGDADILSAGPGLRLFICDKIDVGVGSAFALTGNRWANDLVRTELRWRF